MTSDAHLLATLTVEGVEVAHYQDAAAVTDARLSPRPYLHPVRTLGGTVVTDSLPDDHRWHLGLSVAVQDVGGVNLWGGRTYRRDQGYAWRDDHGQQRHHGWEVLAADELVEDLGWYGPDGRFLLAERRTFQAAPCEVAGRAAWVLAVDFRLRNVSGADLALGSPATNGRTGAGYGGLFWRLPASTAPPRVFTATGVGEDAVHGSSDPWLAWVGETRDGGGASGAGETRDAGDAGEAGGAGAARDGGEASETRDAGGASGAGEASGTGGAGQPARAFTLVLAAAPHGETSRSDPWFVRVESYPGVCSALAFEQPALLPVGGLLARRVDVLVADAVLDRAIAAAWAGDRTGLGP